MINLDEIIRQLTVNAEAISALMRTIPEEQARWKPNDETWSMLEVMGHVYNEERLDFRKHLKEMFQNPPQGNPLGSDSGGWTPPWSPFPKEELVSATNLQQALDRFLREREDSLAWLKGLKAADWNITSQAPWGPISAGDVLVSWVEHDFLHIRQVNELLYAWVEKQAAPYLVQYAGGW